MSVAQHRTGRRRLARFAAAAVCAAGLAVGSATSPAPGSPAPDDPVRPLPRPTARLQLSLTPAGGVDSGAGAPLPPPPPADTVTLTCNPDGGTHPTPRDACDSLRRVNGHFELLPWHPTIGCPDVWDPHTARATGYWQSAPRGPIRTVRYEETFGNRCEAAAATDLVFGF